MRWVRVGVVAPAGGSSSQPSAANCEVDCTVPSEAPRAHPETLQPQPQPQSHSPLIAAALPVCTTPERAASADAEAMHDDHVLQGTPPSPPLDSQLLLPPGTPPAAQDWSSWFDAATPVDAPSLGDSPLVGTGSPLILYEREQATYVASPLTSAIKMADRFFHASPAPPLVPVAIPFPAVTTPTLTPRSRAQRSLHRTVSLRETLRKMSVKEGSPRAHHPSVPNVPGLMSPLGSPEEPEGEGLPPMFAMSPRAPTPAAKLVRVDLMSPDLINPTAASPIVYFERTAIETNLEASHADMHTPRTKSSSQGGTLLRDNAETESGTKPPAPTMDVDKENTMTLQASVFQKLQKLTKLVEGGNDAQPSKQPLSAALTPGPPLKRLDNTIQNARRRKSLTVQAMRSQIEALKH